MLGNIDACIESGNVIILLGRSNIAGMWMDAQSYLRQLHHKIFGLGTFVWHGRF
jgi:hypothetical protein